MKLVIKVIDSISVYTGKVFGWLAVALVLILVFEVIARWGFDRPTLWAHLTVMMTGGSLNIMGLAYAHFHNRHVRIDVIYSKLSPRVKALIDVVFFITCMVPFLYFFLSYSASWMWQSWITGEVRLESWWYPPAAPFRTVFLLGWCIFTLQCLARFFRDFYFLVRNRPYD